MKLKPGWSALYLVGLLAVSVFHCYSSSTTMNAARSDALVDSMGVNVHLFDNPSCYLQGYEQFKKLILALRVRHIRGYTFFFFFFCYVLMNDTC